MIDVVICDDHPLVRRGIRETLQEAGDIRVTGEAGSYVEVRDLLRTTPCQVLLLDLHMPGRGGLEVLTGLTESELPIRVLVLSMAAEEEYAIRCLRAGAQGYLSKTACPRDLVDAVHVIAGGRKYLTPEVAQMLAESVSRPDAEAAHNSLSERELQTLIRIASGKRLSEIADELMLSPKTVSVYRSRVMEKLRLQSSAALTVYAIRNNLV